MDYTTLPGMISLALHFLQGLFSVAKHFKLVSSCCGAEAKLRWDVTNSPALDKVQLLSGEEISIQY